MIKEGLVSETCEDCGGKADMMAIWKGKAICFRCLAEKYREQASLLLWYLAEYKHIPKAKVKTS